MKMKKIATLAITILLLSSVALIMVSNSKGSDELKGLEAKVYKTSNCNCCDLHVGYMRSYGIRVEVIEMQDISAVKESLGIPEELESCHTAVMDGYFVEGHVPVEAISKLVKEKPAVKGIALPGMPSGSPGMPGAKTKAFVIHAVKGDGEFYEFMRI